MKSVFSPLYVLGASATLIFAWLVTQQYSALFGDPTVMPLTSSPGRPQVRDVHGTQAALCNSLSAVLGDVLYTTGTAGYDESLKAYWALSGQEIIPSCFVRVRKAQDISAAIKVLKSAYDTPGQADDVKFAVRSGGHSPEGQFSNVEGGIVLDLSALDHVHVSEDRETVDIGVGARWKKVTSILDPLHRGVSGGRNSDVGVGGFILGGGLSFFSPRFGMACDSVNAYEIVLADGSIVEATATQHADLWKALKGGSGNFGIVTRITMRTFPLEKIWAGYAYWAPWQASKLLKAFYEFNKPEAWDPYAAGPLLAFGYVQKSGFRAVASSILYTKPEKWPKVFQGFKSVWRLWSTHKIQTLTSATDELDRWCPPGFRQFNFPITIKNDLETFEACRAHYDEGLKAVKNVKGSIWSLIFQPISAGITRKGDPNVLGLDTRDPNQHLVIVHISVSWAEKKDDDLVHSTVRSIMSKCHDSAQQRGVSDPWLYLNYAASGQDPIQTYGHANIQFLKQVSEKYDTDAFFQKAKRGGFKLDPKYE